MIVSEETCRVIRSVIADIRPHLDERQNRLLFGSFARALGRGGVAFIRSVTGAARNTITAGSAQIGMTATEQKAQEEKTKQPAKPLVRIRRKGGGRKSALFKHPDLYERIEKIIGQQDGTYGDPERPLLWTTWSLRKIAKELCAQGIKVSQNIVSNALEALGYSKQQNQKNCQVGNPHPDRDAQFKFITEQSERFLADGSPVISIDTKKKENVGNFKSNGAEYRPIGQPRQVWDHDFPVPELGKVAPYGIYVLNDNTGFVNLGISHDTPEFAGESFRQWWNCVGKSTFPETRRLYITCDSGGSTGCRPWLWKYYVQQLANETGLEITVSHFPTGTSKWNKIEHRLFCFISKNWQGKPLVDVKTVVNLISSTTTTKGLTVKCIVDPNHYETNQKITKEQKESLNIEYVGPNKMWNYVIRPNRQIVS